MTRRRVWLLVQLCLTLSCLVQGWEATFDVATLNGANGVVVNGLVSADAAGFSVSGAGDVNGDGVDDFLVGAYWADPNGKSNAGVVYVVFGVVQGQQFPSPFDLSTLDGTKGFRLQGFEVDGSAGISSSDAGDVNGDGVADIIIGAYQVNPGGKTWAGEAYVVFGRPQGTSFPSTLLLSALDGTNGFTITGIDPFDSTGIFVATAGDINKDGFGDVLIGAHHADPRGVNKAGKTFVVFGSSSAFSSPLYLSTLDGTNGFEIQGIGTEDYAGVSHGVGDVNSDGIDDIIVGAWFAGTSDEGEAYVIFGINHTMGSFTHPFLLSSLDGTNGFRITGAAAGDAAGVSVSGAGDINGDGINDVIIGAQFADPNGISAAGAAYIIFGVAAAASFPHPFRLESLDGSNGITIQGIAANDNAGIQVAAAGDINRDGLPDVVVGAAMADPGGRANAGTAYVIFGVEAPNALAHPLRLSGLDGTNGFAIPGLAAGDFTGWAVSGAGDVDGDGTDDLLVGAYKASPAGRPAAGKVYLVLGALAATDECALSTHNCEQACDDTPGSFLCLCIAGYALQADGISCVDQNECTLDTDNCHVNATCSNTVGSFTCACDAGTTANADLNPNSAPPGDGSACFPVDECLHALHNCHAQAACSDTAGSFDCVCNVGYEGSGVACTDVPECARGLASCDAMARCDNTEGSFTCTCNAGYVGSGLVCAEFNECVLEANNTCHEAATCTNTVGSYECACPAGWNDVGGTGEDCVNPLACEPFQTAQCDVNAQCDKLSPGSAEFTCTCNVGYQGDGAVCTDINECAGDNTCHRFAACTNTAGSFQCECGEFYVDISATGWPGLECIFHACEPAEEELLCSELAFCAKNRRAEVVCTCNVGYVGDGAVCTDLNECGVPTLRDNCHPVAACINTQGSFYCECPSDHLGDGLLCAGDGWLVRTVLNLAASPAPDPASLAEQYSRLLLPNGRSAPTKLGTVTRIVGEQLTAFEWFATEAEAAAVLAALSSPQWSAVGGASRVEGPDVVWWTGNATLAPPPPHMRLLSVDFDPACNSNRGCWQVAVGYTVLPNAFASMYLPRAAAAAVAPSRRQHTTILGAGQRAEPADGGGVRGAGAWRRSAVPWSQLPAPAAFPCKASALNANQPASASTACCLPSVTVAYRAPAAFVSALAATPGLDLSAAACTNVSFVTAGVAPNAAAGKFAPPASPSPLRVAQFVDGAFDQLASTSVQSRGVLNPLYRDHKAVLLLDEEDAARFAGVSLADSSGVVRAVETFVGMAEFRPFEGTSVMQFRASQAFLHLERGRGFAAALESSRPHSAVGYLTLRLVAVQQEGAAALPAAQFLQVTWYVDEAYRQDGAGPAVPPDGIMVGYGKQLADPTTRRNMFHPCSEYAACSSGVNRSCAPAPGKGVFDAAEFAAFSALLQQSCAADAHAEMCGAPALQGQFASLNIPLGVDELPPLSNALDPQRVLVKMAVRMRNSAGQLVSSELSGAIDVAAYSLHRLCDAPASGVQSLADVADGTVLVGAAGSDAQWDAAVEVAPGSDIRSDVDSEQLPLVVTAPGIEFGVLTVVAQGTGSIFGSPFNAPRQGVTLEDVITIHIMEVAGRGAGAATGPKADAVQALLANDSPSSSPTAPAGSTLLNAAFHVTVDEARGRASLHPSRALLDLCSLNPRASTTRDMFPDSCVLRRDVESRVPAATALELPRPGLGGALSPAAQEDEAKLGGFMASLLGDNSNARQLGLNFTRQLHARFALDGVTRRAWWINPGYSWAPRGHGAGEQVFETLFDLSQTVFMFALLQLDENPGVDGRRVLLSSVPSGAVTAGMESAKVAFPTSPAHLVATELNLPLRQVSTWNIEMAMTWEEQCSEERDAKLMLVDRIHAALEGKASKVLTIQIPTIRRTGHDGAGVCCPVINCTRTEEEVLAEGGGRRLNHGGNPDAAATLGVVVAHEGQTPYFYVEEVKGEEGFKSIEQVNVDRSIILTRPPAGDDAAAEDDSVWRYWTQHTALVATVCTLSALGCLLCIFLGWWWRKRQERMKAEKPLDTEAEVANTRDIDIMGTPTQGQVVVKSESPFHLHVVPYAESEKEEEEAPVSQRHGLDLMVYGKPATVKDKAPGPHKVRYTKGPPVL